MQQLPGLLFLAKKPQKTAIIYAGMTCVTRCSSCLPPCTFPLMVAKNPRKQPKIAYPPNAESDSDSGDFRQVTDSQSLCYKSW